MKGIILTLGIVLGVVLVGVLAWMLVAPTDGADSLEQGSGEPNGDGPDQGADTENGSGTGNSSGTGDATLDDDGLPTGTPPVIPPGTKDDGGRNSVTFGASYTGRSAGLVTFETSYETHSVDLSGFDPLTQVTVSDENGPLVMDPSSKVTSRSGHHLKATLVFQAPEAPWTLSITATDLAGVPSRTLVFSP